MKAVCFDLDGTICDLWAGEYTARDILIDKMTEATGKPRKEIAETYDTEWAKIKGKYMTWVNDGLGELDMRTRHLTKVLEILELDQDPLELAKLHNRETMDRIHIYPDARQVLADMGEKYRLCMITNGPTLWQREKIEKLDLEPVFEEIIVSGELGHHKPSKIIFNTMTTRMNVKQDEIIYIGNDYRKDIMGAHAAGWKTAWVNRHNEQQGDVTPDYTIKELSDLVF